MTINPNDYINAFKASITRIHHGNGAIVGAGFLVTDQYAITCAHVITQSLGIPQNTLDSPTDLISMDFPLIAPGEKLTAQVSFWLPVQPISTTPLKDGEDIAVLRLESKLPNLAQPAPLVAAEDFWEHPFRVFGFPQGCDMGVWASGVLRDKLGNGWVSMENVKVPGFPVEPGFSGAPIWDEKLAGVVGMTVAAERRREKVQAAFMIPTQILSKAFPDLEQQTIKNQLKTTTSDSDTLPSFHQIKLKAIQENLKVLYAQYEALYNMLNYTFDVAHKISIKEHIKSIEKEIIEFQNELAE